MTGSSPDHAGGRDNYDKYVRGSNIVKEAGSQPRQFWACDHTADCVFPEADCPDEDNCPHKISNPPWGDSLTDEQAHALAQRQRSPMGALSPPARPVAESALNHLPFQGHGCGERDPHGGTRVL
jgi:hypothetical protein